MGRSKARIAPGESHDCSCAAKRREEMSRFVRFLYMSKAAVKIVSKFEEEAEADGIWDIMLVEGCLEDNKEVASCKVTDSHQRVSSSPREMPRVY